MFDEARKPHAYASLTPDVVLDALSDLGLAVDGRLTALSSYENRVYQVMLDDNSCSGGEVLSGPSVGAMLK